MCSVLLARGRREAGLRSPKRTTLVRFLRERTTNWTQVVHSETFCPNPWYPSAHGIYPTTFAQGRRAEPAADPGGGQAAVRRTRARREPARHRPPRRRRDRKSTRLNSSHANISYAVFCLKKKKTTNRYCSMHSRTYWSSQSMTSILSLSLLPITRSNISRISSIWHTTSLSLSCSTI